ncbi:MAG: hypothetical protein K0R54_709 [Clostridiaceae bacterium]|jgi:hypothetical protein|nr:hypothetical protein [Clostridiaceae bacterium]
MGKNSNENKTNKVIQTNEASKKEVSLNKAVDEKEIKPEVLNKEVNKELDKEVVDKFGNAKKMATNKIYDFLALLFKNKVQVFFMTIVLISFTIATIAGFKTIFGVFSPKEDNKNVDNTQYVIEQIIKTTEEKCELEKQIIIQQYEHEKEITLINSEHDNEIKLLNSEHDKEKLQYEIEVLRLKDLLIKAENKPD